MTSIDDAFMQLKGVAARRATEWIRSLRARRVRGTWNSAKATEIARRKVADLARGELRERLAVECERCAREEWLSATDQATRRGP